MGITGVNNILASFRYDNKAQRTDISGEANFAEEVQKAEKNREAVGKETSSVWAGDMVVWQPPSYFGFTYDSRISNKSKEEMTMDEYKQWVMNEMSGMPVSSWYRSTCVGGTLTITEECFERMKTDPEWEKTVLGMVRKMYSCTGIMGTKMVGYQVIGATPEQCHGAGIPVKDGSAGDEESWWEKRHEKLEELLEEAARKVQKRAEEKRKLEQQEYWNRQLRSSRQLQLFLNEKMINVNQDSISNTYLSEANAASVTTAYGNAITSYMGSLLQSS